MVASATVRSWHPDDSATSVATRATFFPNRDGPASSEGGLDEANELREGGSSLTGVTRGMAEPHSVIRLDAYRKLAQPAGVGTTWWDRHRRVPYPSPRPETARQLRDKRPDSDALQRSNIKPGSAGFATVALSVAGALSSTLRRLGNLRRHPRRALATRVRTS
jgi:hypothetical protein